MSSKGRILIADDEDTFLNAMSDLLGNDGYTCACAPDASTAAAMLENEAYDLLISDIQMPGNGKLEFVRQVPQLCEGLPVILVTGYPSMGSAIQSVHLPVIAYLVKPFDLAELLEQVAVSIRKARVHRTVETMHRRLRSWDSYLGNEVPGTSYLFMPLAGVAGVVEGTD